MVAYKCDECGVLFERKSHAYHSKLSKPSRLEVSGVIGNNSHVLCIKCTRVFLNEWLLKLDKSGITNEQD